VDDAVESVLKGGRTPCHPVGRGDSSRGVGGNPLAMVSETAKSYQALQQAGGSFGYSLEAVRDQANMAGLRLDQFQNVFARNTKVFASFGGSTAEVNFGRVMMNRLSISGSTLRPQSLDEKAQIAGDVERIVWPMFENNKARPHIHCTFPLHQAAQAHRLMESSSHIGKILLTIE